MPYSSLADFLEELAQCGELARISVEVDPVLEIAEITRRVARQGGPALLFDRVRGRNMAVVTNLLGTEARVCRALAIESLDAISTRTEALIEKHTPQNWFDRLKMTPEESGADKFRPRVVKSGPAQQVVQLGRDVDLVKLPLIGEWPGESGPAITAGQLVTQNRGADQREVSLCPLQAIDSNRLAVIDNGHSSFSRHWASYQAANEKMPAAVILGGDPAALVAGSIELSEGVDAYHMTGLLRGKALDLVKCRTHTLEVPAEADLVLEGYLDPQAETATVQSAAVGASHFRAAQPAPVLHVTAITHRSHPLFPALVDSGVHGEAGALIKARERILLPGIRTLAPDVVDLHLPAYGGEHRFAFVSIRKRFPYHARQIASALWGSAALGFTKFLILVDAQVSVHDVDAVLAEVGANVAPSRDVFTYDGPAHAADHANPLSPLGRHLAIDATAKLAGEQSGTWPAPLVGSQEIEQLVTSRWAEYQVDRTNRGK